MKGPRHAMTSRRSFAIKEVAWLSVAGLGEAIALFTPLRGLGVGIAVGAVCFLGHNLIQRRLWWHEHRCGTSPEAKAPMDN